MFRDDLLLRTKLAKPRLHRRVLARPGLVGRLRQALEYRVTLLQAGTGYGKTTILAALDDDPAYCLAWYSLDQEDRDPQQFLTYLINAFRVNMPHLPETPLVLLAELTSNGGGNQWSTVLDALVNALDRTLDRPTLLVLDDYHFVAGSPAVNHLTERLLSYLPPDLHVILAARHPINLPALITWRARAEVLEIGRRELAFQPDEIEALFRDAYDMQLTPAEVTALADKTEGWPIALQLTWQSLRSGAATDVAHLFAAARASDSLPALFDYLAHELLDRQPAEIAAFLRDTAVLRELTAGACDAVREVCPTPAGEPCDLGGAAAGSPTGSLERSPASSIGLLSQLHDLDLFTIALGDNHYRYHHLFHDFLRQQAARDPAGLSERHRRGAAFFQAQGDLEEAIYHWLAAAAFPEAADTIESISETVLRAGRLDTVANWIDAIPPDVLADHPRLQAFLGDVYRLRSRFDEALAWYRTAEQTWRARGDPAGVSRALRGQALVYLDTVRPAPAESLLQEALRLVDGIEDRETHARLLELVAENKLNIGKPDEAEALRERARALREEGPGEDALSLRVKLRTGRLAEARQILVARADAERQAGRDGHMHLPRAHRETVLLLALIDAFQGQAASAFALAEEGIALGERLNSPFVTAVGHMRLGHAWQLQQDAPGFSEKAGPWSALWPRDEAIRCYRTAIALGDRLAVRRTRAEAMWGLTRAYGFFPAERGSARSDLASAERAAAEGVETALWAGDAWVAALTELALGASYVLARQPEQALSILPRVLAAFRDCGDSFGRAATRLWLSLAYLESGQEGHFRSCVEELLALCETHGYDYLLTAPTLLGPPDPRRLIPLLLAARARRCRPAYATRLLAGSGLPEIQVHPGYQLRVQTLGAFRVWRGDTEVTPREWQRDKARQLFQLLLTEHGRWLQREEIVDRLWPRLAPEAAVRDFKVALNALNRAIEPEHPADAPFAFVEREGTAYRFRPEADLWLDAECFERECTAGLRLIETPADTAEPATADKAIAHLRRALAFYQGDYLPEALYEDWPAETRERLLSLYLRASDRLATALIERGLYEAGLDICQAILAHDRCWERAYRLMMVAHARQGNRSQAIRAYQRCAEVLREQLDVTPAPETTQLFKRVCSD
ncbi:MAG: hypothetical protein AUK03_01140 [Anaerolineae bacterium CG2_30_64_16]|nr:MAG: hypothetical protein AUK03_01140 [Anaerolineae bacterium CG2_30_64_16]